MKKTFPFHLPDRADARTVEAIKHDVRKYLKRERRKPVPTGVDFWDFACKVGPDANAAAELEVGAVTPAIDALAATGAAQVYVEILAKPGYRPTASAASEPGEAPAENQVAGSPETVP